MTRPTLSELSEQPESRSAATAYARRDWLLVEVPGTWPRDVSDGVGLHAAGAAGAQRWLERTPTLAPPLRAAPGSRSRRDAARVRRGAPTRRAEVRRIELVARSTGWPGRPRRQAGEPRTVARSFSCAARRRYRCCAAARHRRLRRARARPRRRTTSGSRRIRADIVSPPTSRAAPGIQLGRVTPPRRRAWSSRGRSPGGSTSTATEDGPRTRPACRRPRHAVRAAIEARRSRRSPTSCGREGDRVLFGESAGRRARRASSDATGPAVPASCGAEPEPQAVFARAPARGRVRRAAGTLVGDPDDDLLEALRRLADRDQRPEHHARPASGDERAGRRDPSRSMTPRLEDLRKHRMRSRVAARTAGSVPLAIALARAPTCRPSRRAAGRRCPSGVAFGASSHADGRAVRDRRRARSSPSPVTFSTSTVKTMLSPGCAVRLPPVELRRSADLRRHSARGFGCVAAQALRSPRRARSRQWSRPARRGR